MRKLMVVSVFALVALLVLLVLPVSALHETIVIPVDTIIKGPEGSVHVLAEEDIPSNLVGETCDVKIEVDNQDSAHPDSDIRIVSATTLLFANVEDPAFNVFIGSGQIELGEKVAITLTLGGDEVWSAGLIVEITCETITTTTTTVPTTTTTAPIPEIRCDGTDWLVGPFSVDATVDGVAVPAGETFVQPIIDNPTGVFLIDGTEYRNDQPLPENCRLPERTTTTTTTAPSTTPPTLPYTGSAQGSLMVGAGAALSLGLFLIWLSAVSRGREEG